MQQTFPEFFHAACQLRREWALFGEENGHYLKRMGIIWRKQQLAESSVSWSQVHTLIHILTELFQCVNTWTVQPIAKALVVDLLVPTIGGYDSKLHLCYPAVVQPFLISCTLSTGRPILELKITCQKNFFF